MRLDIGDGTAGDVHKRHNPNRRASHEHDMIDDDRGAREWPSVLASGWNAYLRRSFSEVLLTSKMNVLLLLIPFAFISNVCIAWHYLQC